MYREYTKEITVIALLTVIVFSSSAFAVDAPATEATMAQLNEFVVILALVFSFSMGAIFGHMR
jgi:hypothetical protein